MPFAQQYVRCDVYGDRARLVEPLVYTGTTDTFTIPAGFETDWASVPRIVTWLVPRQGTYSQAAVLHDALCVQLEDRHNGLRELSGDDVAVPASAVDTDGILRRVCREAGTPLVRRWLVWTAVRWGALSTPARRAGWWSTAFPVIGISLLAAPVLIPATLAVVVTLLIDRAVEVIR